MGFANRMAPGVSEGIAISVAELMLFGHLGAAI